VLHIYTVPNVKSLKFVVVFCGEQGVAVFCAITGEGTAIVQLKNSEAMQGFLLTRIG